MRTIDDRFFVVREGEGAEVLSFRTGLSRDSPQKLQALAHVRLMQCQVLKFGGAPERPEVARAPLRGSEVSRLTRISFGAAYHGPHLDLREY